MTTEPVCLVPDCTSPCKSRGWCNRHYQRWLRHGDPESTVRAPKGQTAEERLRHHGWTVTESECWEWNGGRHHKGYGVVRWINTPYKTHRLAYEAWVGPIPEGLHVLHSCDNPPCINPDHLRVGTNAENTQEKMDKGRHRVVSGETHHNAKLTQVLADQVRFEFGSKGVTKAELARRYSVDRKTITNIIDGIIWKV